MNLETNFQILDKVNKYVEYEFNFFNILCKYLLSLEKARRVVVELTVAKRPRPKGSLYITGVSNLF